MQGDVDVDVAVTTEPQRGSSKKGKNYMSFDGIVSGQMSRLTIWGHNFGALPKEGLRVGMIVHGKAQRKDDYNGTPQYWLTPDNVHPGDSVPVTNGSAAPQAQVPIHTASALTYRQTLKFVSVTMAQCASITRSLFPNASDDQHLATCQALTNSLYIAQGQGKIKVNFVPDEAEGSLDVSAMLKEVASKLSVSRGVQQ